MEQPQSEPTWQDYADDLYRTKRPIPWGRIAAVGLALILASAASFALAKPLLTGSQEPTTAAPDLVVREVMVALQQQMEIARLSGDGTYTAPYLDNPHTDSNGVTIIVCFGIGNGSYSLTGFRTPGEYFNATNRLPGAVSGPEPTAACSAGSGA